MTEQSGIYAIVHVETQRCYVGSAANISKRWHAHRKTLAAGIHRNRKLQASWSKHGADAFQFLVVELTQDLTAREQFWMDYLEACESGFNGCPIARS